MGREHSEDLGADGRIILRWFLRKQGARLWPGFIWLTISSDDELL